jgi:hypothetical protein
MIPANPLLKICVGGRLLKIPRHRAWPPHAPRQGRRRAKSATLIQQPASGARHCRAAHSSRCAAFPCAPPIPCDPRLIGTGRADRLILTTRSPVRDPPRRLSCHASPYARPSRKLNRGAARAAMRNVAATRSQAMRNRRRTMRARWAGHSDPAYRTRAPPGSTRRHHSDQSRRGRCKCQ